MLDGLLNRGFSSKCKSLMKATRTRIEVVRKRAEAKQRFLKEDLANLLANGLDINAYGRTEEFLAGLNLLSCYDFIEYTCEYILKQLLSMQKQRECPEECREPVASLMFAAARFSDLPELRDLRNLFQERYGSTLECFVNQKFVEILSSKPPAMEKRLQLLKDIASEFSINWNSGGFEQRMADPPTLVQAKPNKHGNFPVAAEELNLLNGNGNVAKSDGHDVSLKETHDHTNGGQKMQSAGEGKRSRREDGSTNVAKYDVSPEEKCGLSNDGQRMHNRRGTKESERGDGHGVVAKYDRYDVLPEKTRALSHGSHRIHKYREDTDSRREGVAVAVATSDGYDVSPKDPRGLINDGHGMRNGREDKDSREQLNLHFRGRLGSGTDRHISPTKKGESTPRQVRNDLLFERRQEVMVDKHELSWKKDETLFKAVKAGTSSRRKGLDDFSGGYSGQDDGSTSMHDGESSDAPSHGKSEMRSSCGGFPGRNEDMSVAHEQVREKNMANSKRKVQQEDVDSSKSYQNALLPPPYIKSKSNLIPPYVKPKDHKNRPSRKSELAGPCSDGHSTEPSENGSNRIQMGPYNPGHEGQNIGPGRVRSQRHREDQYYQDDKIALPKPRSIRRKQHKSSSNHDDMAHVEDAVAVKRSSSSRRRDSSRKGLQILFDDEHSQKDEEERMIDKLLLHYSKKPSTYGGGNMRKGSQAHPSHQISNGSGESSHDRMRDGHDSNADVIPTTTRSISLPRQETTQSEAKKVFTRAKSFHPDGQARHVHPKLPDYDDLAARFAALKGR
ncbi:uncharacterized protein [Coffea arabica]|uniref:IST1-like protein n=1 Tax=Coffea arabica TaxID=13443 RepID=A0A6P6SM17_COFAR|nr:uncharacterized protein LOC113692658 [Coffea arabica]XP_027069899.1 uncharacterized protein LOC113695122 [Coffea arabica]